MTTIKEKIKTTFTETFDREWMEGEADNAVDLAFNAAIFSWRLSCAGSRASTGVS